MCAEARDFFFDHQFLLFQLGDFEVVSRWTALEHLDRIREVLVLLFQFLQMRTQAHGYTPLGW